MKSFNPRARHYPMCDEPCKKTGKTAASSQRWYCKNCLYSFTPTRTDQQKLTQFREFCDYITDTEPKHRLPGSLRTWDQNHAWYWDTRPIWQVTGEVYDHVFIDGTYIPYGWCVLVAYTSGGVIAYQLCHKENKEAYRALLSRIPAPIMVVTDGNSGALAAIKECWPTTRIQRCLVHIQRNIRTITTIRPKTQQHKALYRLGLDLTKITTTDEAIAWQKKLAIFHELYDTWLEEKTYRDQVRPDQIPTFARKNKKWWHTHKPTRTQVRSLDRYVKDGVLFAFLEKDRDITSQLASTTNPLEGGINSPLKAFLYAHRGWTQERMLTAIDYWLYHRSIDPQPQESFANNIIIPAVKPVKDTPDGPAEIDKAINIQQPWEDSLHIRKGWIRH